MDFKDILYTKENGIATIILNRPETRNALTLRMLDEWLAAIEDARTDDAVRVVVVTGAGRGFCAGVDIKELDAGRSWASPPRDAAMADKRHFGRTSIQRIPRALEDLEKPYIAAVNGAAMGAGMDLCTMADMRIAGESARFAMGHFRISRLSLDGGYFFLPRLIGLSRTLDLVLTGRMMEPQEALAIGYVAKVVPDDRLQAEAQAVAAQIAAWPAVAVSLAKRLIYRGFRQTVDDALEEVELASLVVEGTDDAIEGPRAWVEKREPRFKGR